MTNTIETHVSNRFAGEQLSPLKPCYEKDSDIYYRSSRRQVYPCIIYPLPQRKYGDLQLALCVEIYDCLYYGLLFYKGDCVYVPEEVGKLADAFPDPAWKKCIAEAYRQKSMWLWQKYLPAQNACLGFRNCSGNELYCALYDPESYREIMDQILSELDRGIGHMLETGLPEEF